MIPAPLSPSAHPMKDSRSRLDGRRPSAVNTETIPDAIAEQRWIPISPGPMTLCGPLTGCESPYSPLSPTFPTTSKFQIAPRSPGPLPLCGPPGGPVRVVHPADPRSPGPFPYQQIQWTWIAPRSPAQPFRRSWPSVNIPNGVHSGGCVIEL